MTRTQNQPDFYNQNEPSAFFAMQNRNNLQAQPTMQTPACGMQWNPSVYPQKQPSAPWGQANHYSAFQPQNYASYSQPCNPATPPYTQPVYQPMTQPYAQPQVDPRKQQEYYQYMQQQAAEAQRKAQQEEYTRQLQAQQFAQQQAAQQAQQVAYQQQMQQAAYIRQMQLQQTEATAQAPVQTEPKAPGFTKKLIQKFSMEPEKQVEKTTSEKKEPKKKSRSRGFSALTISLALVLVFSFFGLISSYSKVNATTKDMDSMRQELNDLENQGQSLDTELDRKNHNANLEQTAEDLGMVPGNSDGQNRANNGTDSVTVLDQNDSGRSFSAFMSAISRKFSWLFAYLG